MWKFADIKCALKCYSILPLTFDILLKYMLQF